MGWSRGPRRRLRGAGEVRWQGGLVPDVLAIVVAVDTGDVRCDATSSVLVGTGEAGLKHGESVAFVYRGEIMGAEDKLRFDLPDGQGNYEPTDIGVIAIDSVTRKVSA